MFYTGWETDSFLEETMRRTGDIRVVRGPEDELLAIARDLVGVAFCVGVMVFVTFLAGRWG